MARHGAVDAVLDISGPRMLATADKTSYDGWPVVMRSTVRVLAQCPRDRTEDECILCLYDSVHAVDWDVDAARGDGGVAAAVVAFNCYLRNLTSGCGATTRRAGVWTDGCFVAYADTDDSSSSEDAFRSRVLLRGHVAVPFPVGGLTYYPDDVHAKVVAAAQLVAEVAVLNIKGPRLLVTADETRDDGWPVTVTSTVRVLAQCPRDRPEVDCSLCLYRSAQAMDWDLDATRGDGGVAAAVVGFNCYLRFEVSSSVPPHSDRWHDVDVTGTRVPIAPGDGGEGWTSSQKGPVR
ncbi:hypothetical protein ACQ4PT_001628 [Festuca glaucescens]